jgi:hypothetical protein
MKSKPLNMTSHRLSRWCITITAALSLSPWAFGQAIYEQRFNEADQIEFKDGAALGPDGSGVSGKPKDKAYSADTASSPKTSMIAPAVPDSTSLEELTVTAWYKPRAELPAATTLFNAFGTMLIWDDIKHEWTWRVGAKLLNPDARMYWFFSGKAPLANWAAPGEWTFVAMVWKRQAKSAAFYQGNKTSELKPAREMTRPEEVEPLALTPSSKSVIGNDTAKTERAFNGEIDNVRFFPKALDQNAIEKIRQADVKNEAIGAQ